jgi:predicted RNase H-like nuclease (RuvC/YqgF family)
MLDMTNAQLEEAVDHIRGELRALSERIDRLDREICDDRGAYNAELKVLEERIDRLVFAG